MIEIEKPPQLKNFGLGRFFWIAGTVLCAWLALPLASSHYEWHKGLPTELAILELRALVALVIQIWLVALRLKSIGWNRWYSVAMVIPFVSLWIGAVCIVCPPNYRTNKQFDPGSNVAFVLGGLLLLFIAVQFAAGLASMGHGRASTDPVEIALLSFIESIWMYSLSPVLLAGAVLQTPV